ncbi:hypothetical protein M446_2951 [Methylobacterium sp. 4-46]|uniref:hypothetical protein n=1 Tax=unclassified Methylobacterium TaxID=2615210 RepID=UPI000152DB3D|nr:MULTISPECIES: hypothetical protein [Methylobacterium]ACA17363.1 hypothetical protein M446_2951 [Methylobacterium sp. 4-46]WFT83050.1 hypothetical protein QA634_14980 [Methylobacterium nodulans]
MRLPRLLALGLLAATLGAGPLAAQNADPGAAPAEPGSTGTVNRNVMATGQTKPPGRAAAPREANQPDRVKELNRKVDTGICIGCD